MNNAMGEACSTCGGENRSIRGLGNLKERDHLGDLDVDGVIILKFMLKKSVGIDDWIDWALDRKKWWALLKAVLGSIQCGEFLDWVRNY